jgi:hypothetical protein
MMLAEESLDGAAVSEGHRTDAERRRDSGNERSEGGLVHQPSGRDLDSGLALQEAIAEVEQRLSRASA